MSSDGTVSVYRSSSVKKMHRSEIRRSYDSQDSSVCSSRTRIRARCPSQKRHSRDTREKYRRPHSSVKARQASPGSSDCFSSEYSKSPSVERRRSKSWERTSERSSPCYSPYRRSQERADPRVQDDQRRGHSTHNHYRRSRSPHRNSRQKKNESIKKRRKLKPNASILATMIREQVRRNDRMDREEVRRANIALKQLDPNTKDQARLMTEYLCTACSRPS